MKLSLISLDTNKRRTGIILIAFISTVALIGVFFLDPIQQDTAYHNFTDSREIWGIPNFWNVISNTFFMIVGVQGVFQFTIGKPVKQLTEIRLAYIILFLGVALVSLGSSYYHLWPDNQTLVWDRLPMTIAFMALFTIIVGEFVSVKTSQWIFLPLVLVGFGSVLYWYVGELNAQGDLRIYLLVQFLPILLIPVILVCFRSRFDRVSAYWWLLLCYVIAKLFEYFDAEMIAATGLLSGHSLKHMVAAFGLFILLGSYRRREVRVTEEKM